MKSAAMQKEERAAARRKRFAASKAAPHDFLRRQKVSARTQERYANLAASFFASSRASRTDPAAAIDAVLSRRVLKDFLAGEHVATPRYLVHAIKFDVDLSPDQLPKTFKALNGYKATANEKLRDPNTWEMVVLQAAVGWNSGDPHRQLAGIAAMVQFDILAGPSEVLRIDASWIFPVVSQNTPATTGVTFFPSSQEATDKTRQQDDTLDVGVVTQQWWLGDLLRFLAKTRPTGPFFPMSLNLFEKCFHTNCVEAGLLMKSTPHGNRHGGASLMALAGMGSLEVQTRGRWASSQSVLRYRKHGRYLRVLNSMPAAERDKVPSVLRSLRSRILTAARTKAFPTLDASSHRLAGRPRSNGTESHPKRRAPARPALPLAKA